MKRQALDILLLEDDGVLGGTVAQRLRLEGLSVLWVQSVAEALEALQAHDPAILFSDIRLPDGSGEEVFRQGYRLLIDTEVIFATAYAEVSQAVALVKAGAADYLLKPYDINEVVRRIKMILSRAHLPKGVRTALRSFHYDSPEMATLAEQLKRLARVDFPVLLVGETGTGKEMAARLIHESSDRAAAPFLPVSCADISEFSLESKYFGHEQGAFPHATMRQHGWLEEVGKGTLFLDEICEMHPKVQAALARVLQDGHFRRLGGSESVRFNGRVIAASNADLDAAIQQGHLRQDLYYRLQGAQLTIPPLRERVHDIIPIADSILAAHGADSPLGPFSLSEAARVALVNDPWPGNIRELSNRLAQACALTSTSELRPEDIFPERKQQLSNELSLTQVRIEAEREEIERVIAECGGRLGEAAKRLGISRTTLWKRRRTDNS